MKTACTILVIEDEPHILELVQSILATSDAYEVLYTSSAAEGLRAGLEFRAPIRLLLANVVLGSR